MQTHRARKRFGQNFLCDGNVIDAIIAAAELNSNDNVLEIGPGQGALTLKMLPLAGRVDVIEIDRDLARPFADLDNSRLHLHTGDALKLDWEKILVAGAEYKLVANLPYNISSQVLFKMIQHRDRFSRMVLMFQKEVADRLRAVAGSRDYGALTILSQLWFAVSSVVVVPPTAFRPPPKVTSEVLCFTRRRQPLVAIADEAFFRRVVKGAFAQRRKTLRNCLLSAGFSVAVLETAATDAAIDLKRRGETLTIEEFASLAAALQQAISTENEPD